MGDTSSERKHYEYIGRTVDHLGKKISALEDENAKLRDELANAPKCEACEAMLDCDECLRADGSHKERRRLKAKNAKLMELCVQMVETVECSSSTKRCALFSECEAGEFEPCLYEQKLRNLGIEVPE